MQVTETKYNAIARTLNLFGLNPTYVRSLSPEDCKQMLEQISQEYIEKEKLDERVVVIDFEEHLVWSRIFYPDGSNIIFPNKEDQDRYRNELDDFISSFSIEENEFPLIPLPIKEAIKVEKKEERKVQEFPLIPLPIKEAIYTTRLITVKY